MSTLADVYNLSPKEISVLTYSKVEGLETRVGNHSAELKALEDKMDEKLDAIWKKLEEIPKSVNAIDKRVDRLENGKSVLSKGIDYGITGVIAFLTAHLTK